MFRIKVTIMKYKDFFSLSESVEGTEPNVYYHVTFQDNEKKIKKFGIKYKATPTWTGMARDDIRLHKGIFVFDNYYDAMKWAFKSKWHFNRNIVIIKIKTAATDFINDNHWEMAGLIGRSLVKQTPILPDEIVEIIPFDDSKWTPEFSLKLRDLQRKKL